MWAFSFCCYKQTRLSIWNGVMRTIDARDIQKQFEDVIGSLEKNGPISVQSNGRDVAVILSPALLATLLEQSPEGVNPQVAALFKKSLVDRWQVYAGLRQYEVDHPEE